MRGKAPKSTYVMLLFSREASVCSRHPTSGRGHFVLAQRECRGSHTHVNSGPSQLHQLLPVYCWIFQLQLLRDAIHYHHTYHNHATVAICPAPHASQASEGRRDVFASRLLRKLGLPCLLRHRRLTMIAVLFGPKDDDVRATHEALAMSSIIFSHSLKSSSVGVCSFININKSNSSSVMISTASKK